MSVSPMPIERRWIHEVAEIYRRRGYQVQTSPAPQDVPDFLSGFKPDIIAQAKDESVLVEVKARGSFAPEHWRKLAETVRAQPGWRLDLFVRDPGEVGPEDALTEEEIRAQLSEAMRLGQEGNASAGLVLAWAATEAAMRLIARKHELELRGDESGTLLVGLYSEGFMEREDYDLLDAALEQRNAVAHGYRRPVSVEDIARLQGAAERILAE